MTDDEQNDSRVQVEKWILRSLLLTLLGAAVAALAASVDDIQRYIRIRQM